MHVRHLVGCTLGLLVAAIALSQPAELAAPKEYDVTIRYRIDAIGNERLVQFFDMVKYLNSIGFKRAALEDVPANEAEDPKSTRLSGSLPAEKLPLVFGNRNIKAVRIVARGANVPDEKDKRVRVELRLASGLAPDRRRLLVEQTRHVLSELGFQEAVGYDQRGLMRLMGSVPAGQLDLILDDLRQTPAGAKQPAPFQNLSPILIVEVQPNLPVPTSRPATPAVPPGQERLSPEVRELLTDEAKAAAPARLEVLLSSAPPSRDQEWLKSLPGFVVEGRLGTIVTMLGRPADAVGLAALPNVVGVRLPRLGRSQVISFERKDSARPLLPGSTARLHPMGRRGKGVRLAVIDADFRGWEAERGRGLPGDTRLLDMTREHNPNLEPDPMPAGPAGIGTGTRCALAAARIAPEASLTLIRIDPAAPYQLDGIARSIGGDLARSINLERRLSEMERDRAVLELRRADLAAERRIALEDFSPQGEETQQRKDYIKKKAVFDRDERDLLTRIRNYQELLAGLNKLRGIRIVTSGLAWPEGYPVDGSSALSRAFDDRPFRAALWFQAAGDTRGQAWTGLFRDEDSNGVMEFVSPGGTLPEGVWTPELNFLAWQPAIGGNPTMDLPANARLRLSLQWREPHVPALSRAGEDGYREPIADLRLVVLQQLDPAGKMRPADDLEVVVESAGVPMRIESNPNAGTYEQTVELRVTKPGRYAVRIEGKLPESDQPRGSPTLPAQRRPVEIRPRLFVQTLAGAGRAVFDTFVTQAATIAMPGDAHYVTTIGAADDAGKARPFSAPGPAYNLELRLKPDAVVADEEATGAGGTGLAAAHAAGLAAVLKSAGASFAALQESIRAARGDEWRGQDRDWQR